MASRRRQRSEGTGPDANAPADGPRPNNARRTHASTTTHQRKRPRNDPNTGTEPGRHHASVTTTSPVKVPSVQQKAWTTRHHVVERVRRLQRGGSRTRADMANRGRHRRRTERQRKAHSNTVGKTTTQADAYSAITKRHKRSFETALYNSGTSTST